MASHNRFRWCKRHVNAVMHMIGEMEVRGEKCSVKDASDFMNVSKPTARKYLVQMVDLGYLYVNYEEYRPHVNKALFSLAVYDYTAYCGGYYRLDFEMYCKLVLGVTWVDSE